jgi:hypothetical protein
MTPLFACFPVLLTFFALAFLALTTGMVKAEDTQKDPLALPEEVPLDDNAGPPKWWVIALIFAAVGLLSIALAMISEM